MTRRFDWRIRDLVEGARAATLYLVVPPYNEAFAVFVRFWPNSTPALPDTALAAAHAKGRERYEAFVDALGHA